MTDTLPAGTAVGRVALRVADLAAVGEFYERTVGLRVHERDADRLVLGAANPLVVLREAPNAPARGPDEAGLYHTAFRVPTRAALGDALGRIERRWDLDGATDHRVSEALYLSDPEGNGVEIYCDRPREDWPTADGRVGMTTERLPLGDLRERATGAGEVPAGTDVGHVHLEVSSLEAARRFYVDALGLAVRQELPSGALFAAAGGYHHHVGLNTWQGRSRPVADGSRGLEWFEVVVPADALAETRERVTAAGYDTEPTGEGIAVTDEDGVVVRLRPPA